MNSSETPQFEGIIGSVDGESGYLSQCLCGKQFDPWDAILSIERKDP